MLIFILTITTQVNIYSKYVQVKIVYIIENTTFSDQDFSWEDGVEEEAVENLLRLIGKDMHSRNPCLLRGGDVNVVDLIRSRNEKKLKEKYAREKDH